MQKSIYLCDCCGEKTTLSTLRCITGRESDGVEMSDNAVPIDLCPDCTNILLRILVTKMTYEEAAEFVKLAKRHKHE